MCTSIGTNAENQSTKLTTLISNLTSPCQDQDPELATEPDTPPKLAELAIVHQDQAGDQDFGEDAHHQKVEGEETALHLH